MISYDDKKALEEALRRYSQVCQESVLLVAAVATRDAEIAELKQQLEKRGKKKG